MCGTTLIGSADSLSSRDHFCGKTVVILIPPLMRLCASESRCVPPGIALDIGVLEAAGCRVHLVHADAGPQPVPTKTWQESYETSEEYLTNKHLIGQLQRLWPEIFSRIDAIRPDYVLVPIGSWAEGTKDWADFAVSLEVGRQLRACGIRAIAYGSLPTRWPNRFAEAYSSVITGPPGCGLMNATSREGLVRGSGPDYYARVMARPCATDVKLDWRTTMWQLGCVYGKCAQCPTAEMFGCGLTSRPLEFFVNELAAIEADHINIVDTCFALDSDRLPEISKLLEAQRKGFTITSRVELADQPDVVEQLVRMGTVTVKLGIESLSDKRLRAMNKGQTVTQIERCLGLLSERMKVFGYLLLGGPGETADTLEETLAAIQELDFVTWLPNVFCPLQDCTPEAHHWSRPQARKLGLPLELVDEFFRLAPRQRRLVANSAHMVSQASQEDPILMRADSLTPMAPA